MRKLVSLLLALVLVFGLATTAFAEQEGTITGGSITIDNAVVGQTYNVYQILYLESYDATSGAYAYKANSAWAEWLKTQTTYVSIDDQGYVTWKKDAEGKDADAAAFAKAAQAYATTAKGEGVTVFPVKSEKATSTTVSFADLKLGYYLVDSTLGTLCSLDTTNPTVTIKEKNAVPENVKTVEEDSTGIYGTTNDADFNQTVNFKSTITAQAGAENYVFHDKMSVGLSFGSVTGVTLNDVAVNAKYYTVKTTGLSDDCTFEVVFTQDFCDTLKANDKIVISYTATLNQNAVVGLNGNPNKSKLSYGDSSNASTNVTPPSTTITYTWDMDVLKYANGDKKNTLEGVKFVLIKKVPSGDTTKEQVATVVSGKLTGWVDVPAAGADGKITWPDNTTLTTDANGKISIKGLDADTYYLREIEALPGYNVLSADKEFTITGKDADGSYETILVEVENKSGTELPSTGGMGTTIFYILGSVLVLAAGVLLVTRKRMSAEN